MFAVIRRRSIIVFAPQNADLAKSFSSATSSFTVSYLINTCGLSSNDAVSVSKKLWIKSPERPDAVLELLKKYGFTNAHIAKLVARWPSVLQSCPNKTLLPKLEFFRSIGVPLAVSAHKFSVYPQVLQRSLENYLIPSYNYLKSLVQSDKEVVNVFKRAPRAFAHGSPKEIASNIATLREKGVPETSIVSLVLKQPSVLLLGKETFTGYVDRAAELGFDRSKCIFIYALQVFDDLSESTLKHKMDVYRRCGWSNSDVSCAFLRFPFCMRLSEKKIMANMEFLVGEVGFEPGYVAKCPVLLGLSLEKRMRPRWIVTRALSAKGLLKKSMGFSTLLKMTDERFLKTCIVDHLVEIPELLEIYHGKMGVCEIGMEL